MDETTTPPHGEPAINPAAATGSKPAASQRQVKLLLAGLGVIILAALAVSAVFLVQASPEVTSQIRDVFIIFMALEFLLIGVALVILIIQLAVLTNMLRNEVKPILDSTNETVNTMRGTVTFLSNNLVDPVIKLNSYLAGLKRLMDLLRPGRG